MLNVGQEQRDVERSVARGTQSAYPVITRARPLARSKSIRRKVEIGPKGYCWSILAAWSPERGQGSGTVGEVLAE